MSVSIKRRVRRRTGPSDVNEAIKTTISVTVRRICRETQLRGARNPLIQICQWRDIPMTDGARRWLCDTAGPKSSVEFSNS